MSTRFIKLSNFLKYNLEEFGAVERLPPTAFKKVALLYSKVAILHKMLSKFLRWGSTHLDQPNTPKKFQKPIKQKTKPSTTPY